MALLKTEQTPSSVNINLLKYNIERSNLTQKSKDKIIKTINSDENYQDNAEQQKQKPGFRSRTNSKSHVPELPLHNKNNVSNSASNSPQEGPNSTSSSSRSTDSSSTAITNLRTSSSTSSGLKNSSEDTKKPKNNPFKSLLKRSDETKNNIVPLDKQPYPYPLNKVPTNAYLLEAKSKYKGRDLPIQSTDKQYEILVTSMPNDDFQVFLIDTKTTLGEGTAAEKVCPAWNMKTKELLVAKYYRTKTAEKDVTKEQCNLIAYKNNFQAYYTIDKTRVLFENYAKGSNLLGLLYESKGVDEHQNPIYINKKALSPLPTLQLVYKFLEQLQDLHQTAFDPAIADELRRIHLIRDEEPRKVEKNSETNEQSNPEKKVKKIEINGLLHRDLKPANILVELEPQCEVTLVDMADAIPNRIDGQNSNTCCASNGYTPPEVIGDLAVRQPYTKESDYYQAGVVIAEIISSALYQSAIQKRTKKYGGVNFNDSWTPAKMYARMSDVFITEQYQLKLKPSAETLEQNIMEILYKHLIFPKLCKLANSMTMLDPKERLKNTSLQAEIDELKELEKDCILITSKHFDLDSYSLIKKWSKKIAIDIKQLKADHQELVDALVDEDYGSTNNISL